MITSQGMEFVKEAMDLSVNNADLKRRDLVERSLEKKLLSMSRRKAPELKDTLLTGGGIGALVGGLAAAPHALVGKSWAPLGAGLALGGALGAGAGALVRNGVKKDIDFAKNRIGLFQNNPDYREALYTDTVGKAMAARDEDAHYKALARNAKDTELHNQMFGSQFMRR